MSINIFRRNFVGVVGWCDGAGLTSSAGASYKLDYSRARAYCTSSWCGRGCLGIFTLIYHFIPPSPPLLETARYRLKYCLKGPINPKPTNQPTNRNFVFLPEVNWKYFGTGKCVGIGQNNCRGVLIHLEQILYLIRAFSDFKAFLYIF